MGAPRLTRSDVEEICRRCLKQRHGKDFVVVSHILRGFSDTPSGYLARHESLHVQVRDIKSGALREVVFFIKSVPSDIGSRAEYLEEFGVFKKEITFYRDVLPRVQADLPEFSAQCFYTLSDVLVFENLVEMGYRMGSDRSGILDFDHMKCALWTVARLHASSIVFEANSGRSIPEVFPDATQENAYPLIPNNIRLENFNNANKAICELIKVIPKYQNSPRLKYILREFPIKMERIYELSQTSSKYFNVLSHGDLWANNLLFKYDKTGRPLDCRMVDFQLTRFAPPILDVITLLTIPTSRKFRENHLETLLENYYSILGELLSERGLDIKDYITQTQFEDSVRDFTLCGLIESCLFSHMTILPTELTRNLLSDTEGFKDFFSRKRSEICLQAFNTDELYRHRMTDMISDIVDNHILA